MEWAQRNASHLVLKYLSSGARAPPREVHHAHADFSVLAHVTLFRKLEDEFPPGFRPEKGVLTALEATEAGQFSGDADHEGVARLPHCDILVQAPEVLLGPSDLWRACHVTFEVL